VGLLVEVDDAAWPLVIARIPEVLDEPAIDSMLQGFDRVLERSARFATLIDTSAMKGFPDARARSKIGEYMKARTMAEAAYNLGNAVVILSAPARAALTAINWLRRPVTPQYLVGTAWEGIDWCCERLKGAGIDPSRGVAVLRARDREQKKPRAWSGPQGAR
jgi:hypothetical protein